MISPIHLGFRHERHRTIENRYRIEKGAGMLRQVNDGIDAIIDY